LADADPSQAFADTPIGQSLLKLDESQRKRLESLFNTAYGVVKAGKPFSDYELICAKTSPRFLCRPTAFMDLLYIASP
jgi:hypothetical protein